MLSLLKKPEPEFQRINEDLQELLLYMIRYGKPKMHYLDSGWYAKVEMNTNTKGTQFDVASEFGHSTPISAAKECHERIINAMKTLTQ